MYSIERINELAENAQKVLLAEGFTNVEVRIGDGSLGWPEAAPFDAIAVAAGAPIVPEALKQQLAIGGRLVLPVGANNDEGQQLLRITRVGADEFETEELAAVRFVPLIGKAGWDEADSQFSSDLSRSTLSTDDRRLVERIAEVAEPFDSVDHLPLEALLERIGDSRIVLLGEASHGTSEFYRARQRITRALIEEKGFDFIAIEGDWPDVARIDHYVRHAEYSQSEWTAFARFPTWMWRNKDVHGFVDWLREHNADCDPSARVAMYGLDLYSLFQSIDAVVEYLDEVDPKAAAFARERYDCLTPFKPDLANYGLESGSLGLVGCEPAVLDVLQYLEARQSEYAEHGDELRPTTARCMTTHVAYGTYVTPICSIPSKRCWPIMVKAVAVWSGRITRISAMRGQQKERVMANSILVSCVVSDSVMRFISSALAPTAVRLRLRRTGMRQWRSKLCVLCLRKATSNSAIKLGWRVFCCHWGRAVTRRCAMVCRSSVCSGPLGLFTVRIQSVPATILKQSSRVNLTSTSGSSAAKQSPHSTAKSLRGCLIHTPSACNIPEIEHR